MGCADSAWRMPLQPLIPTYPTGFRVVHFLKATKATQVVIKFCVGNIGVSCVAATALAEPSPRCRGPFKETGITVGRANLALNRCWQWPKGLLQLAPT